MVGNADATGATTGIGGIMERAGATMERAGGMAMMGMVGATMAMGMVFRETMAMGMVFRETMAMGMIFRGTMAMGMVFRETMAMGILTAITGVGIPMAITGDHSIQSIETGRL
jgi:hypothetical protein